MIRRFAVEGLSGKQPIAADLHEDINLLTGKNGSGKTTLLKLLWYIISGNVEYIPPELSFSSATVVTDRYRVDLHIETVPGDKLIAWRFKTDDDKPEKTGKAFASADDIEELNHLIIAQGGASLFFPTFRRIEGGFSMGVGPRRGGSPDSPAYYAARIAGADTYQIQSALSTLSRRLTVREHQFVASISTEDIVSMLQRQYANVSNQLNEDQALLSKDIIAMTKRPPNADPKATLAEIAARVERHSILQEQRNRAFTSLGDLIGRIFRHKGIEVTNRVTLGQAQEAISSDKLSAGEKQMLSFLVYNGFTSNGTIFIDEPEISLHVDWQRQLVPLLVQQQTTNQFIMATHSPFIYSAYADKELAIDVDRGDSMTPNPPA